MFQTLYCFVHFTKETGPLKAKEACVLPGYGDKSYFLFISPDILIIVLEDSITENGSKDHRFHRPAHHQPAN
jgi:hypothetical protein